MFYDRQGTYLTTEEFSKIQKSFELKNLKKVQDMKMGLRNWQKQPDFIKHYTILKEQGLVKVPVGVRGIWQDRFTDNYGKVEVVNHPKLINPFGDEEDLDLTEKQDIAIESLLCKNVGLLHRSTGTGKAQPLYSKIMGENGWITMGETKIGDKIFGEDGNLYNITGIFPQGKKDIYEIIFSDGTKTRSCGEHLWKIQDCNDRKRENRVIIRDDDRVKKETYQILELNKIKDNLIKYKGLVSERLNYSIDIIKPLLFNKKELSIHPYLLGLYLGDGTSDYTSISISNSESDIIEKIKLLLNDDLVITQCYDKRSNAITNSIRKKINGKSENSFLTNIKELGLCGLKSYDKFIPKDYLHSSVEDRLLLLQGLLDTDGYVMKGRDGHNSQIEYSTTSEKLKDDIIFLANSLGCNTTYIKRKSGYKKDGQYISCKDHYRIYIYSKDYIVSSKKHLDKYSPSTKIFRKYIKEVNYIGEEECKCIMVDNPSHLYITDDFIITHNTSVIAKLIDKLGCKTLIVCCNLELMNQMRDDMEMFFGVKYRTISGTKTKQKNCYEDIIIGNIDSLVKLPEEYFEQFDLVLMDEVDRFMQRDTRREFIFSLPMKYQYGLTGTIKLNHIEDRIFDIYFGKKTELLLKHFQPTIYKVMTDFEYILDDIKDFHELKARLYGDESRNQLIVDTIVKTINGRKGIVFCEYIEHSKLLCDMLEKQGIKTFMLIGDIKKDERARIKQELKDYKGGPCCLVGSVKIVGRGFSVPELSSGYLLTCEKFSSNIFQYIGRILRLFPGKTSCDFYDFVDTGSNILANQAKARNIQYKKEFPGSKIIYYK